MSDFYKTMKEYLHYLQYFKNYSSLTIKGYQRDIEEFIQYCQRENISCFETVKYSFLRGYLAYLHTKNLSPKTINHHMSSLRAVSYTHLDVYKRQVQDVQLYDHHDILVVKGKEKIMIPYVDAFIVDEDIENKRIDVHLIEGFL